MFPTENQKKIYLQHIGFTGEVDNSFETLKKIVEGHCFAFPYETLNLHDSELDAKPHKRSNLDIDALFKKLIQQKRGGRCVELNIPLQAMLKAFGFEVQAILPEMLFHNTQTPKAQRPLHSAAIVTVDNQKYLVDAAFGGLGILSPLPLKHGEYNQFSEKFKLIASDEYAYVLQIVQDNKWVSIYGFDNTPAPENSYEELDLRNRNPSDANSLFRELFVCSKSFKIGEDKNGRYRIRNNTFTTLKEGKVHKEKVIETQDDFHAILKDKFNIDLKKHYIRFSPVDMKMHLVGIHRPPVLHRYPTRYKEDYIKKVKENGLSLPKIIKIR